MSLTNDLRFRVCIYKEQYVKTELGDTSKKPVLLKKIWADIRTTGSGVQNTDADISKVSIAYSIIIRSNALSDISEDMFIIYKKHRYNIESYRPYYKNNDRIELLCSMVPSEDKIYG